MLRAGRSYSNARALEQGRWSGALGLLHLSRHYAKVYDSEREALLASGLLTNVSVRLPQDAGGREKWYLRETALLHGTNMYAILLRLEDDEHTFTCRTPDVKLLLRSLGE